MLVPYAAAVVAAAVRNRWGETSTPRVSRVIFDTNVPRFFVVIGLPVVDKLHGTLKFHAWFPGCPMEEDAYGIPKPKDTEVITPTLLFVPCVGYGLGGYRLGYGGGFYDRTLANLQPKPYTVGLGYSNAFLLDLKPEPHDVPLNALLNDQGVVWPVT